MDPRDLPGSHGGAPILVPCSIGLRASSSPWPCPCSSPRDAAPVPETHPSLGKPPRRWGTSTAWAWTPPTAPLGRNPLRCLPSDRGGERRENGGPLAGHDGLHGGGGGGPQAGSSAAGTRIWRKTLSVHLGLIESADAAQRGVSEHFLNSSDSRGQKRGRSGNKRGQCSSEPTASGVVISWF